MNENELRNFLSTSKQNCRLGTVDTDGDPNVHPVWFYYEPDQNRIYINTNNNSRKIRSIRKKNSVYFCIDDETPPVKGVKGKGSARISENPKDNLPIVEKIMTKYLDSTDHPTARYILETVKNGKSVLLEITPSYFSTWDFGKN